MEGPKIPEWVFFICAGLAILIITGFLPWYAGNHRDAFKGPWETIWADFNLFLGMMFGVEASYCPIAYPLYSNPMGSHVAYDYCSRWLCGSYGGIWFYNIFSIPSLITAIVAAVGIRLFGLYDSLVMAASLT